MMGVNRYRQRGLTMWGWLYVIVTLAGIGIFTVKAGPVYLNDYSLAGVLKKVAEDPSAPNMSTHALRDKCGRYFNTSYIEHVEPRDIKVVKTPDGGRAMTVSYEVKIPMFYNVTALFHFEHSQPLPKPQYE